MDARQIQDMRALLAAQIETSEARPPSLARTLKGLWAPKPSPWPAAPLSIPAEPVLATPSNGPEQEDEPLLLLDEDAPPAACEPIPLQILLGGLAPRRPAFGQRIEPVLDLREPAPTTPQRLTLLAPDGEAVGEIILHAGDVGPPNGFDRRRPFEPQHSEAPFFPEDLADEPVPSPARKPMKAAPKPATRPAPELAATFLLATLAARLASEEAALRRRLRATLDMARAA